jgi:hypothetical protein
MQYYYRYLSLFHLGEYEEVLRDTDRNMRVFDLIRDFAEEESDRIGMEQFPPLCADDEHPRAGVPETGRSSFRRSARPHEDGIERIENALRESGRDDMLDSCREILFLQEWSERIQTNRPLSLEEKAASRTAIRDRRRKLRARRATPRSDQSDCRVSQINTITQEKTSADCDAQWRRSFLFVPDADNSCHCCLSSCL